MKSVNRSRWMSLMLAALVAGTAMAVGATRADSSLAQRSAVERIVPIAMPLDVNPCSSGACF